MTSHTSHSVTTVTRVTATDVGAANPSRKERHTLNERYLSVTQVAEVLGTSVRFPRRLVEERRIPYVKVGRHVRIPESAVREYIASHTVEPMCRRRSRFGRAV